MARNSVSITEINRLYSKENWSVAKIAAHLGTTRQTVYEQLRRNEIKLRKRVSGDAARRRFDRETLRSLYEDEKLTVGQIAQRLNADPTAVLASLRAHNIRRRSPKEFLRKFPSISELRIGESFTIPFETDEMPTFSFLLREAKRLGLRIVIRRLNRNAAVIIRTQLLLPETVRTMFQSGMTRSTIAEKFYCSTKTISKILREMGISKRER